MISEEETHEDTINFLKMNSLCHANIVIILPFY